MHQCHTNPASKKGGERIEIELQNVHLINVRGDMEILPKGFIIPSLDLMLCNMSCSYFIKQCFCTSNSVVHREMTQTVEVPSK